MAYQSPENAQKLRDMPRVATNNAEPMVQAVTQSLPSTETSSESGINWGAIGEGLRGFGAGYDGRGTEFIAGLNKQNERLDKSRQQAMLKDLSRLDGLLSEGSFDEARQLLVNRAGFIDKFGGNSSDTKGLVNLMDEGKNEEVRKLVSREIGTAVHMGLMKPRAAVKTITVYNEETGRNEIRVLEANGQLGRMVGLAKQGEAKQTINVGSGETTEQKELSKAQVLRYSKGQEKGDVARDMIFSLDKLYAMDDLNTGALAPLQQSLGQMANALGMNDDLIKTYLNTNVSQGQTFIAETASMILKIMATQKGPQTNEDRIQIAKTIADLGNTPEANRFINNSARAIARRDINRAEFEQEHYDRTKSVKGSTQAWRESIGGVPMISKHQRDSVGLPLFYHDFFDAVKNAPENENVSNKDILKEWKKQEAEAKQRMTNQGSK